MAHLYYGVEVPQREWTIAYLKNKMSEEKQNDTDEDSSSITSKYTTNKYLIHEIKEYEKRDDTCAIRYVEDLKQQLKDYKDMSLEERIDWVIERNDEDYLYDACDEYEDQLGCSFFTIRHIVDRGHHKTWYYYGVHWSVMEDEREIDPILSVETRKQIDSLIKSKFNQTPCYILANETFYT